MCKVNNECYPWTLYYVHKNIAVPLILKPAYLSILDLYNKIYDAI